MTSSLVGVARISHDFLPGGGGGAPLCNDLTGWKCMSTLL